jgi:hypothetical protein
MSVSVRCAVTAMAPGRTTSFQAYGGVEPYTYAVVPDGAGGTVNASTGVYAAPSAMNSNPRLNTVRIQATDDDGEIGTSDPVLVADPLFLFMEILWRELGLSSDRVYLWDQKLFQPTDSGLYVVVSVLNCKPFGNTLTPASNGDALNAIQSVNMLATLSLNVMSRSTAALLRKEEVLMALASQYSQSQQEQNSFYIGKLPPGGQFVNLSQVDGAAIPYRFNISVNMQYFVKKTKDVQFFDEFEQPEIVTDP